MRVLLTIKIRFYPKEAVFGKKSSRIVFYIKNSFGANGSGEFESSKHFGVQF